MMTYAGVLKIARFNWPWCALAGAATAAGLDLCLVVFAAHEIRRADAWSTFFRKLARVNELRARHKRVQYRLLYFFHGRNVTILTHALTKQDVVPAVDIERALQRRLLFERDPEAHTHEE